MRIVRWPGVDPEQPRLVLFLYLFVLALPVVLALPAALIGHVWLAGGEAQAQATTGVHEGTAGPYHLVVEVVPALPVAGKVQLRVRPALDGTGEPVTDAHVEIYIGRDGHEEIKTPALNAPADRTTYTGNADLDRTGDWQVRVRVEADAGTGDLTFELPVRPRVRSGGGLVAPTLVFAGAAVIIVGGVAWLVVSSRRARARGVPVQ